MARLRRVLFTLGLVVASVILVMDLKPGSAGAQNAAGPVLLLARLRLNGKVPVLY